MIKNLMSINQNEREEVEEERNNKACREVVETSETTIFASLTGQTTRKRLSMLHAISLHSPLLLIC